jgi:hypothetical protein
MESVIESMYSTWLLRNASAQGPEVISSGSFTMARRTSAPVFSLKASASGSAHSAKAEPSRGTRIFPIMILLQWQARCDHLDSHRDLI